MRSNYWSCSKLADWIRGVPSLSYGTQKEWNEWDNSAKTLHPLRFWIAETLLDKIQDIILWPTDTIYSIKYYTINRWFDRTNALTAHPSDIKPGEWCDVGYRFLPCLFNELVDFVEVETPMTSLVFDSGEMTKKFNPPWHATGPHKLRMWRSPEAGLYCLQWASSLVCDEETGFSKDHPQYGNPTSQAIAAKEIIALYTWWKNIRPTRPDASDESGWAEYCKQRSDLFFEDQTEDDRKHTRQLLNTLHDLEEQYEQEDEEMMIRLIKIRRALWT